MDGGDSHNAFIDCIIAYSKNLETNSVSADLEVIIRLNNIFKDLFYKLAEGRDVLPE